MLKNKSKWWILFVTTTATSLFLLDTTILPVALPAIEKELQFSAVGVIWVINAYLLSLTAFMLIGGKLCEIFGFRTLFNWGLAFFGVGALCAAFSQTSSWLILARVIQGIGSACAFPASASLLISAFPINQKARALGIDTGIASLFMILGPILGGIFAEYLSWRFIFLFYLPFVCFGLTMSMILVEKSTPLRERFPFFASLLMMIGIICLVTGLMEGNSWGWKSPLILIFMVIGPIFMALFVIVSVISKKSLCDFSLFKNPLFFGAAALRFLAYFIITASVLWIVYFEKVLHYSPAEIGGIIVIASLPVIALAPIGGIVADKFWYRVPLVGGFLLLLFGLGWMSLFVWKQNLWLYLPGFCAFGIALPFVMAPTLALGLSHIPAKHLGSAAGMMMSIRQLASTIGIAVMTALYYSMKKSDLAFFSTTLFAFALTMVGLFLSLTFIKRPSELHS